MDQDAHMRRIIDNLSTDLNNLSSETKRKFAPVKEASEACLLRLRQINSLKTNLYKTMCDSSADVIRPLILGCETKQPKIIQICLASAQKVIEARILNVTSATMLVNTLWLLCDHSLEELKILQTLILLVTTTDVVKHTLLAKTLTIALRLLASKDQTVMNTATAMIQQMVTKVFDRVLVENKQTTNASQDEIKQIDLDQLKILSKDPPGWMNESAQDAYMFLQDLYLLLNSDQSLWLQNINDLSKPFGLELLKSILVRYPEIFKKNPEMCFILKERICPLLIKLFSPSTKLKLNSTSSSVHSNLSQHSASSSQSLNDQKSVAYFSIVSRLIRIVFVLIQLYFELLITESEIFLSLLTKFLDVDRPLWQKALAIEVFHKISVETNLIRLLILNYDMKQHPEKIFSLITSGISLFIQSLFLNAATTNSSSSTGNQSINSSQASINSQQQTQQPASGQSSSNAYAFQISSAQPSFIYKDVTIQLLFPYISGQVKATYLDTWDKSDVPYIQDGYLLSIGFATLQELTKSVQALVEQNLTAHQKLYNEKVNTLKRVNQLDDSPHVVESIQIMNSCSNSFLFVYNILLESSLDETITDQIIKSIRIFIYLSSLLNMNAQRDAFVTSLCKAALPANYAHNVLNLKQITDLNYLLAQTHHTQPQPQPIYSTSKSASSKTHSSYDDSSFERQIQVVATGPALLLTSTASNSTSSSSLSNNSANILSITAKNLLIMKAILNMTHIYAELIGSSWYIILNTMQHITWTLGLKPGPGSNGQLKNMSGSLMTSPTVQSSSSQTASSVSSSSGSTSDSNQGSMITTAIQTEIAFICNMLSKLFESTRNLSNDALNDIIDALMKLSIECSDLAYLRSEPCLFAVAKLFETCIANLNRIDLFWQKVTVHLLCSCKHTNIKYREWCVDSICNMIKSTFNYKYSNSNQNNNKPSENSTTNEEENRILRDSILNPLSELSTINFNDVRQKQLDCTLSILRLMGQFLNESWPLCLNIIGAIQKEHSEQLIRSAFQCLQIVVTDFVSMIKANYFSLLINVVSKFGSQEQDLNISLTAIVLLWNISDYMFRHSDNLNEEIKKIATAFPTSEEKVPSIESVWMVLYSRLGQMCVDPRPSVRKSGGQTLFCTISSHGSVLSVDQHWKDLVWNVLFPLLEQVRHFTNTASREKDSNQANLLMHHSRDTAEKQWAETSVLTLSGVTKVFNSKCSILVKLENGEFHRMWLFLLNIIESLALSRNSEIAQSALRGFHELLGNNNYFSSASSFAGASNSAAQTVAAAASAASVVNTGSSSANLTQNQASSKEQRKKLDISTDSACVNGNVNSMKSLEIAEWLSAWQIWLNIGNSLINSEQPIWPPPTQTYLTCYVELVSVIVEKLAPVSKFFISDFESFSKIIDKLLAIPVLNSDYSSFILMQVDTNLTPLQNASLNTLKHFIKLFKTIEAVFQKTFISHVFHRLLSFVLYACYNSNPSHPNINIIATNGASTNGYTNGSKSNEIVSINFVTFGEKALVMVTNLYEDSASHESVIEKLILKSTIQTLYVPLSLKYSCPNASTWKLSIECLFKILRKALPIIFKHKGNYFETMWLDLAKTFEDFLFTKNLSTTELSIEAIQKDEIVDCQVIELIRDEILTHSNLLPQQFIQKVLAILNRGSIYSNTFENFLDIDSTRKLREEFSKTCFETLLRFSFVNNNNTNSSNNNNSSTNNEMQTNGSNEGSLTKLALTSMLNRCKEIIQRYVNDERLSGSVPLPRPRINEMIGVLKALCTLINALKKAPKESIQASIWNQVIGLYPNLVECTTSPSQQISNSVKEVLLNYFTLLRAP